MKPLLMATWLHHAFVAIHPFQDGNGRVARMLASLVLIKNGLFPLTVKRGEVGEYYDALNQVDEGIPQPFVDYICSVQEQALETAFNLQSESKGYPVLNHN